MAAQAGAEARGLGGGSGRVEADVAPARHDRGAARAAVDPGGGDGDEEAPVEAVVAATEHAVARLEVLRVRGVGDPPGQPVGGDPARHTGSRPPTRHLGGGLSIQHLLSGPLG